MKSVVVKLRVTIKNFVVQTWKNLVLAVSLGTSLPHLIAYVYVYEYMPIYVLNFLH